MSELHFSPRPNRASEIAWHPYSEATFSEAKSQAKPVLLAISAVWCHWCHVMDETTYSDPGIIKVINEQYVPVRVDNDQRPDVNARYNMGGWPTTALLTPEGELLHGGTYVPPDAMASVLRQISSFYSDPESRLALAKKILEVKTARAARSKTPTGGDIDPNTASSVFALLSSDFDDEYGGFGTDQKFPHVPALHFLLDYWQRTQDGRAQTIVQVSLRAMAGGGMYDRVDGGFFRYSTTRDFSVPHFEKMLEDLGGLMYACARAGAMFGDAALSAVARDVKRYLDAHLWNEEWGGYGGSQDADEEFYAQDSQGRAALAQPYVDRTLYTAWNAQAAAGLLLGAGLLSSDADTAAWSRTGELILNTLWDRLLVDGLLCRYYDGTPHVRGLLVDQAWALWAGLAAFSKTGNALWLARVGELLAAMEILYDADAHGYADRLTTQDDAGKVADVTVPFEENALMARVLLAYSAMTGDAKHVERAEAMLRRYSQTYQAYGSFAASYAAAALDLLDPPVDIHIVQAAGSRLSDELRVQALACATSAVRVDPIDARTGADRLQALGYAADNTVAYLCRGKACFARASTAAELAEALAVGKAASIG
ncbi:MAG: thioredoxin domain-containing protein [Candidatus Eremiobacter antarcticus]|nr:thioredoxin domain-containing protein [Candidatus Eremiobacteraeota bacterium]MBC5807560.1 thioredoxin domain-containing protein [Candidatus Eremiobacteraeota bacterium]